MFRHYGVILRELVNSTLSSYTIISNAAVGNTNNNLDISHKNYASSHFSRRILNIIKSLNIESFILTIIWAKT
jgi:hypothetical protein